MHQGFPGPKDQQRADPGFRTIYPLTLSIVPNEQGEVPSDGNAGAEQSVPEVAYPIRKLY